MAALQVDARGLDCGSVSSGTLTLLTPFRADTRAVSLPGVLAHQRLLVWPVCRHIARAGAARDCGCARARTGKLVARSSALF